MKIKREENNGGKESPHVCGNGVFLLLSARVWVASSGAMAPGPVLAGDRLLVLELARQRVLELARLSE